MHDRVLLSFAMQRSGHHAVLNQLCHALGSVTHLNYCTIARRRWRKRLFPRYGRYVTYRAGRPPVDSGVVGATEYFKRRRSIPETDHLLFSFENEPIGDGALDLLGAHGRVDAICILRDPFNMLASVMRRQPELGHSELKARLQTWKTHAQACLSGSRRFPGLVDINYNRWTEDRAYRSTVFRRLDLDPTDAGLNEVPDFGGGSSFDQLRFAGRGSEMSVHRRWRHYENEPTYRRLLEEDPHVVLLAERYFGTGGPPPAAPWIRSCESPREP